MNATLLHPGPPHVPERSKVRVMAVARSAGVVVVVVGLVVDVTAVASLEVGESVVSKVVAGFVVAGTESWLSTSTCT